MNWLALVPYLMAIAIGAGATWPLARAPLQGQIADLRTENTDLRQTHAESVRMAILAVSARLQSAQAAGDKASQRLAAALAQTAQLTQEKRDALKLATTGRACLSERAVRLLNGEHAGPTGTSPHAGVPAPTSEPAATGAASATDSDVSEWIAGAQQKHQACRDQVDALIGWHQDQQPAGSERSGE